MLKNKSIYTENKICDAVQNKIKESYFSGNPILHSVPCKNKIPTLDEILEFSQKIASHISWQYQLDN